MYNIEWKENAVKEIEKLETNISRRIYIQINGLAENLYSYDIKRLKGVDAFRLRVGDYRVIFEVKGNLIIILKIGHRKNIYKR